MVKQGLFYLALSILVVLFSQYVAIGIVHIGDFYTWLNLKLSAVFSHTRIGLTVQKIIVLMLLPILVVSVPALIYRLIKGSMVPHYLKLVWLLWLVVVLSKVAVQ